MNIGALVKQMTINKPIHRFKSPNKKLDTSKGIFSIDQDLYGDATYVYYVLLIYLFDRAMIEGDLHTLSVEQQKLLEEYFKEADFISDKFINIDKPIYESTDYEWVSPFLSKTISKLVDINNTEDIEPEDTPSEYVYDFSLLSPHINTLDEFLGSYFGEDHEQYSEYDKKQFYSQRQPFGTKA